MRKIFTTAMMALAAIVATFAQTANNDAVSVSWALTTGNLESGVCSPETQSLFVTPGAMAVGSGITITAESSSDKTGTTSDGYTQTFFKASKSGDNAITFSITPKAGITFTPTKVGLKAARWKTDKGSISVAWVNGDGSTTTLGSFTPKREATDPTCSIEEYTLAGSVASDKTCQLVVTISGMDGKKTISMGDVFIEGTTYGTVGQPITHNLSAVASPAEGGNVSVVPAGSTFERGSSVTLSQTANDGWVFTGWYNNGALLSTSPSYTFNIMGNMDVEAKYQSEASLLVGDYAVVDNVSALRATIKQFNENPSAQRRFIFLKNGTYDYGTFVNTESEVNKNYGRDTIKVDNVSIIGESTDGVTITITPTTASVSRTAPIMIQGTGTYLQNITFHNNYDYSGNDGQAAALHDRGHHTIGKWLKLESRQDTYYSHTNYGQLYFEDTQFVGTVDFICGRGDVFFNRCDILCLRRYANQGIYTGDTHIAAPYTWEEDYNAVGGHGYIFMDCHVDCQSKTWDFGRGWRAWPKAAFLNTTLSADAVKRVGNDQTSGKEADNYAIVRDIDYSLRVSVKGVKSSDDSESVCRAFTFYEYNTMDEKGNVVSPASNVLTFTAADSKTMETILKADEIDRFQLRNVFPDWTPDQDCKQVEVTSATLEGSTLTWTTDQKAKAYLIEKAGTFVDIIDGTQTSYTVSDASASYTVRAANMMGGFGVAKAATVATGIQQAGQDGKQVVATTYYSLSGARIAAPQHGVYIVVKTMNDGTIVTTKETK